MNDVEARVREFLAEYPEAKERMEQEVSQWPPMSAYALSLWKAAKLTYLRDQQEQLQKAE